MKKKGYNDVHALYIVTVKETRNIEILDDKSVDKVVKFIKRAIQRGQLEFLCCCFGDQEEYSLTIHANETYACVLIINELERKAYDYCNKKYENDMTEVILFGYDFCKACLCEDKDILFDIIMHFFETGKINEKYEWYETEYEKDLS